MKIRDVLDVLSSSEIVLRVDVIVLVEEPGKQALRARASLNNGFFAASKMRLLERALEATLINS